MSSIFDQVIGHSASKEYLSRILREKSLAHAYCFSGPASIGKTTLALSFGAAALGVELSELASHPDVIKLDQEIDEKTGEVKAISVEDVRALCERLSMTSLCSGLKLAIISNADTMTPAAQNALLKTLEEPRGDTLMILIATDAHELLDTILSRVVHLRLTVVEREKICELLQARGYDKETSHALSGIAVGRPGKALRLTQSDDRSECDDQIQEGFNFLKSSLPQRLGYIESFLKTKPPREKVNDLLNGWRLLLHDLLLFSSGAASLIAVSHQETEFEKLASLPQRWIKALSTLGDVQKSVNNNGNLALALEQAALTI